VPTAYILCEKDNTIPARLQEKNARNLGEGARVVRFDSGHSPYLSRVEEVGKVVREMAGEEIGVGVAG
jgi:pimeloyl-ACP methyl ester carboxylesterase